VSTPVKIVTPLSTPLIECLRIIAISGIPLPERLFCCPIVFAIAEAKEM
jgi:hypothetical protein